MDEATKLLREWREAWLAGTMPTELALRTHAHLEALPAAAPRSEDATLRELLLAAQDYASVCPPSQGEAGQEWARLCQAVKVAVAYLAHAPAAAPREEGSWTCIVCGQPLIAGHRCPPAAARAILAEHGMAAAQPAPLPGPPREPTVDMLIAGNGQVGGPPRVGVSAQTQRIWQAMHDKWTKRQAQGEGDCVIAPNPAGVQGQSTMQAGGETCDQTKRLADPAANSLSRAGDDAAERKSEPCPHEWEARWQQSISRGEIRWRECKFCGAKR